jgi:hypothetical protein
LSLLRFGVYAFQPVVDFSLGVVLFCGWSTNPEGIEYDSPGLPRSGYPGITVTRNCFNPERVAY